ncbi:efflux RND transporter periplasmic adaptor subunit [Thiomicrorhabdus sp. ZW0627]|uniref:efflux RND transporter periplasmic adaptor subunit n=1 Tax=Thiomicrorhabdus sp. ZW0627 TaxID=3039774 RepID=UPI0024364E89|nr:efflux RND transporter periplasmic adaptor subunit [Thiomicrorhabdus sp. ZW0627]MDG6773274.1 efflux RND transporter periplasmic adaptor subunit [Thiomicrorhabdus sp. ZW0627]
MKLSFCRNSIHSLFGTVIFSGLMALTSTNAFAENVTIGALVSGQVTKVNVEEGQEVKAGTVLLEIDQNRYKAKLAYLKAELAVKKAQYEDAKIELDQALDLFDRTVTAKRTLDAAQLQHDVAKANVDKAQAELKMAQSWGPYFKIKAPFSAKVVKIHAPMGTTVYKENNPLIELETK